MLKDENDNDNNSNSKNGSDSKVSIVSLLGASTVTIEDETEETAGRPWSTIDL